jgi:hypothetical protein
MAVCVVISLLKVTYVCMVLANPTDVAQRGDMVGKSKEQNILIAW